ncbi:MAG: hypothetical protein IJJ01_06895 [Firmicutes bacterium]|nr:hypothetical protein [Bacillota bacterium]
MSGNMFMEAIKTEQRRIQRFIDLSRPDGEERGSLYIKKQGGQLYAYERWQQKGGPVRKVYLGLIESDAVQKLFTDKFKVKRLKRLQYDQKLLEKLERQYQEYDFENVVADMPKAYRMAARNSSFNQRYEKIREWAEAPYPRNTYPFPEEEIYAKNGTRLRSKGECIWYNLLLERGILFRYDCAVTFVDQLGNRKTLCPDFLILCFDGTLILIEHLGGIGDLSYAMDFGKKSYWYLQEGFILGKNYFITSDDLNHGTDSQMIARHVDRIEEMFYGF